MLDHWVADFATCVGVCTVAPFLALMLFILAIKVLDAALPIPRRKP